MRRQAGQLALDNNGVSELLQDTEHTKPSSQTQSTTPVFKLGNFESPVLKELSRRTVNKELETQRIIANAIAFALWNLLVKFIRFFRDNTHMGAQFCNRLSRFHLYLLTFHAVKQANTVYYSTFSWLTAELVDYLCQLVISLNILFSLWKLLSTVKVADLSLTKRQRKLLGVDTPSSDDNELPHRAQQQPHYVPTAKAQTATQDKTHIPQTSPNHPAYLFKGLETPLKTRQRETADQAKSQPHSLLTNNVFGSLQRGQATSSTLLRTVNNSTSDSPHTPVIRKGYIPSSKYAYMMNSQTPRKKI
ncbi:hypothetical protein N7582_003718 [Saccharomyces uvarum]|uniref:Nucleoporin POM34 n=1 Tax=Saccharomyces uvarum TaxID=230603 RepID=A0AA35J3L3_SACUV|nr:hypothetical protein N7582_003718 [Saccharomyces uvarum]CAI4046059.1 hypothetical protein SUVC_12G0770 [Saccharomyces uvarum]